ncbi:MAG: lipid asymmetry maintenance protein MlaB [Thioalkalivibrionaceae bacterium]
MFAKRSAFETEKPVSFKFETTPDGVCLHGALVRDTVSEAFDAWTRLVAKRLPEFVDVAGLDELDSAGLALMVVMSGTRGVQVSRVPEEFSGLLRLYRLEDAFADSTVA